MKGEPVTRNQWLWSAAFVAHVLVNLWMLQR